MKPKITVFIRNEQKKLPVTPALRRLIRSAVSAALTSEGFPNDAEVSVTLTDDEGIRELNREYRRIDRPTDVLSFPQYEKDELSAIVGPAALGDVVISLERAEKQAAEYGHGIERETAFLTVHSILHLLGYDHESAPEDEADMFARQEAILTKMGLTRNETEGRGSV